MDAEEIRSLLQSWAGMKHATALIRLMTVQVGSEKLPSFVMTYTVLRRFKKLKIIEDMPEDGHMPILEILTQTASRAQKLSKKQRSFLEGICASCIEMHRRETPPSVSYARH